METKNYSNFFLEKMSDEEFILNMGPQHPSTHGVLRVILKLEGETVKDLYPDVGYIHCGIEKMCEYKKYPSISPYPERLDYLSAVNSNLAYVMAVEKLLDIDVPIRAKYIRTLLCEINRITSHLLWFSAFGMDVGALTPIMYAFREREELISIMEEIGGGRLTHHAIRIGGFLYDLPTGIDKKIKKFCSNFDRRVDEYEALLVNNVILKSRTINLGILSKEKAIDWGVTGPSLRGSGVNFDLRKNCPYLVYDKLNFNVPLGKNGDTFDRVKVRMDEMRESKKIIEQIIEQIPSGEIIKAAPKIIKPKEGMVYYAVEGARGEFGVFLVSDGSEKPYRIKFRTPSFSNLSVLKEVCIGAKIQDIIAIMGSFDFIIPEIDR